jgi:hypothetical protein
VAVAAVVAQQVELEVQAVVAQVLMELAEVL